MVEPKPDGVDIPGGYDWEEMTPYQRYYYKNREEERERVVERKESLRKWYRELKETLECESCGYDEHPAAIDFHHTGDKEEGVGSMVNEGYSRQSIKEEIERCKVLCANCHRVVHSG
jgi:hypothetical protein